MDMDVHSNKKNNINISIDDILPAELVRGILMRIPIKNLVRLRCVSKLWNTLISDPNLPKSHFDLSLAPSHRLLLYPNDSTKPTTFDLDALFLDGPSKTSTNVSFPPNKENQSDDGFYVFNSCRGFVALFEEPHYIVIWNPLTRSHRVFSCEHAVIGYKNYGPMRKLLERSAMFGFGYDASEDDYLVLLAWKNTREMEDYLGLFSLRTNSWTNSKVTLPNDPLKKRIISLPGLFLNGTIHWWIAPCFGTGMDVGGSIILVFDMIERHFWEMPVPKEIMTNYHPPGALVELGGCLAICFSNFDKKTDIWIMKEYRVQSSWTAYKIPCFLFRPLYLSNDGDIIGFDMLKSCLAKYNVNNGEMLQSSGKFCGLNDFCMYTESLLALPDDFMEGKE
ncbi:F-box/kelch-repeat protein At3g23880-like [Arachis stenosperma]|uniref:F-box/kelch-repeat protein At3g23880-like n=1 Tax=Arachis stenosperma TaxID=217475 RepID=UPI0025AD8381|nr:F-box/kelch-repeat protein At3g23880-like [Arachis stenosperma]